ncbi:hypothetical protein EVA_12916 [gut metagenome]|uniref:Uncharacterized protein n=1 Tax=gut metagenome TaxID=749906 RepID=J9GB21_9ZZZZ
MFRKNGFDKGLYNSRIKVLSCLILQLYNSFLVGFLVVLGAGVEIAVIVVGYGYDAGANGDVLTF